MTRILVTGGCGFIGSHTVVALIQQGYEVVIIDSLINSSRNVLKRINKVISDLDHSSINSKIRFYEGDLRDMNILNKIFKESRSEGKEIEGVIHFAALKSVFESTSDPLLYWDNNVFGTLNLLKIMSKYNCKLIVFSSSATVYGNNKNTKINETAELCPINPYGTSKLVNESLLREIYTYKSNWCISNLRYFNPIGAHQSGLIGEDPTSNPSNIFPIINKVALNKIKYLEIFGNDWSTPDGTGVRDYIHVMDLAEGHIAALDYLKNKSSEFINLNLGTGFGTSVMNLVKTFESTNSVKIPYIISPRRNGDVAQCVADNTKALDILNWEPSRNLIDMCRDGWNWQKLNPNGYE